jgi:capsular polysaccharide biosynthesis protein/MinD-like ATPase involved in chromosome partitioning or flagellar assembly
VASNSSAFLVSLRRRWVVPLAAALVAGLGAFLVARAETPTYEAETQLLVGPISGDFNTLEASRQLAVTYADVVTSRGMRAATARELDLGALPESDVDATANDLTRLLTIRARSESPRDAASIANTLGQRLAELSAVRGKPQGNVQVVDPAQPPAHPIAPRTALMTALGAFAGLLIGLGLLALRSRFDGVVRQQSQLEDRPDLAFAETIPSVKGPGRAAGQAGAHYRLAIGKIEAAQGSRPHLVVVSGTAGEPGAAVALGLARTWRRAAGRVLLIDADELDASLTRACNLEDRPGLAEAVQGQEVKITAAAAAVPGGIDVLPRGGEPLQLTETRIRALLDSLVGVANLVIVKISSPAESAGSVTWFAAADASVIVATRDRTQLSAIADAVQLMHLAGAQTVGAVLYVERADGLRPATETVSRTAIAALRSIQNIRLVQLPFRRSGANDGTVPKRPVVQRPTGSAGPGERVTADRRRLQQLIDAGLVRVGSRLRGSSPHGNSWALVRNGGELEFGGDVWASPTEAATRVTGRDTEGLSFWQTRRNNGFISLAKLARMLDNKPSPRRRGQSPDA